MYLKEHLLYSTPVSIALIPFFGLKTLFFFLASILMDIDHYLDFIYYAKFRDWKIKNMFRFHDQMAAWRDKPDLCALETFHTAEFVLALLLCALYFRSTELYLVFSGMIFHLTLDFIRLNQWGKLELRAHSFIEYWIRIKRMKQAGIDPEKVFGEAYRKISQSRGHPEAPLHEGSIPPQEEGKNVLKKPGSLKIER